MQGLLCVVQNTLVTLREEDSDSPASIEIVNKSERQKTKYVVRASDDVSTKRVYDTLLDHVRDLGRSPGKC